MSTVLHARSLKCSRIGFLHLLFLAVVILASILSANPLAAQPMGDHWQITYAYDGTSFVREDATILQDYAWWVSNEYLAPPQFPPSGFDNEYVIPVQQTAGLSATYADAFGFVRSQGTIYAIIRWVSWYGGPPNSPPPAKISLLEYAASTGSGMSDWWSVFSGTADNGKGDPAQQDISPILASIISSGKHLIQADSSSGIVILSVPMRATLQRLNQSAASAQLFATCYLEVIEDPRTAEISCEQLEDGGNFHKGANNLPIANVRNADGSMQVDTIPDVFSETFESKKTWVAGHWLTANLVGFDLTTNIFGDLKNVALDWNIVSGEHTGQSESVVNFPGTGDDPDILNPLATHLCQDGATTDLPYSVTVKLKATDLRPDLSATAENIYTIITHKPLENAVEIGPRLFERVDKYPLSAAVSGNDTALVLMVSEEPQHANFSWSTDGGALTGGILGSGTYGLVFTAAADWEVIVADIAFNAIGYAVSKFGTATPDPDVTSHKEASFGAFTNAIAEQAMVNRHATEDELDCHDEDRIYCDDGFDSITANPQAYWNYGVPMGACHSGMRMISTHVEGDGYSLHGFTGRMQPKLVFKDRFINPVWHWTLSRVVFPGGH